MALGDEVHSDSDSDSPSTYDELEDALIELTTKYKKLAKKFLLLSNLHASCDSKYDDLLISTNETTSLKDEHIRKLELENKSLHDEIVRMASASNDIISSKNISIKSLEGEKRSLCKQLTTLQKSSPSNTNALQNKTSTSHHAHTHSHVGFHHTHLHARLHPHKKIFVCTYCMKQGHISTFCWAKKNLSSSRLAWVPKGTKITNPHGPNVWVPKATSSSFYVGSHSSKT
jgi:hypothetical protein